jgi:hypothetical protein
MSAGVEIGNNITCAELSDLDLNKLIVRNTKALAGLQKAFLISRR